MQLEEILGEGVEREGIAVVDGRSLIVKVDTSTAEAWMFFYDAEIDYNDKEQFYKPSEEFLDAVIGAHEEYKENFRIGRESIFEELAEVQNFRSDMERISDYPTIRRMARNERYKLSIQLFLKRHGTLLRRLIGGEVIEKQREAKTLKRTMLEQIKEKQREAKCYRIGKNIIEYGLTIMEDAMDKNPDFPEPIKERYNCLIDLCKDIRGMYLDTISRMKMLIQGLEWESNFYYGKSLVPLPTTE